MDNKDTAKDLNRRNFLRTTAAAGAGIALAPMISTRAASGKPDDLNVALLGAGAEGQVLMTPILKGDIPGIRFKAVCDIWTNQNQKRVSRTMKAYRHDVNTYVDYQDMLAKEKDLDAVIIATPDFWHAPHTIACLEAGLDVYC
jgi:predicted dehydrogenase